MRHLIYDAIALGDTHETIANSLEEAAGQHSCTRDIQEAT